MHWTMDFSKAVKGTQAPQSMLKSINSRAEIELGRKLLDEEISELSKKYSLQYIFDTTEKVIIVYSISILMVFISISMGMGLWGSYSICQRMQTLNVRFLQQQSQEMGIAFSMQLLMGFWIMMLSSTMA